MGAGNLDLVNKLQEAGAGGSALHMELRGGKEDFARDLLLSQEEQNETGDTLLHLAANLGHHDIPPWLLNSPDAMDALNNKGHTPLHLAAKQGSVSVINVLLKKRASMNILTYEGYAPLHLAAKHGRVAATKALLMAGAHIDLYGGEKKMSALSLAASKGHIDVMAALIQHNKANLDAQDIDGCTALHRAAARNQAGAVEALIAAGANIGVENERGQDALSVAFFCTVRSRVWFDQRSWFDERSSSRSRQIACMITTLLKHGADTAWREYPLFHAAVCAGNLPMVEALFAAGADVHIVFGDGIRHTVVHKAASDHPLILNMMIQRGANIKLEDLIGLTPLHYAALTDNVPSIELLIDAGATIDAENDQGQTPLHLASMFGRCTAMHAFLRCGANIHAVTKLGLMPLHVAVNSDTEVLIDRAKTVNMLLRWGADETRTIEGLTTAVIWEDTVMDENVNVSNGDVISVRRLLATAAQDKAWRRRGWLVLCRSRPVSVQLKAGSDEAIVEGKARHVRTSPDSTDAGSGLPRRARRAAVSTTISQRRRRTGGLSTLVATVVSLHEDGLFRIILEFL